jgi:hypothetical protein
MLERIPGAGSESTAAVAEAAAEKAAAAATAASKAELVGTPIDSNAGGSRKNGNNRP